MEGFLNSLNAIHEELSIVMEGIKPPQFLSAVIKRAFFLITSAGGKGLFRSFMAYFRALQNIMKKMYQLKKSAQLKRPARFVLPL